MNTLLELKTAQKRIIYSDSGDLDDEPPVLQGWKDRKIKCYKYVDDCLSIEKQGFLGGQEYVENDQTYISVRAQKSENHLRTVEFNSSGRVMIINKNKTKILCISASKSYQPTTYIMTNKGTKINFESSMRVLGFNFSSKPNVKMHLKITQRKFKCRVWSLRHLK